KMNGMRRNADGEQSLLVVLPPVLNCGKHTCRGQTHNMCLRCACSGLPLYTATHKQKLHTHIIHHTHIATYLYLTHTSLYHTHTHTHLYLTHTYLHHTHITLSLLLCSPLS